MKYFLDTSFILALVLDSDSNHENALKLIGVLSEDCYINNNVLNEVLSLSGRKLNIDAAREIYYGLIDTFTILNEYDIVNYNTKTFEIFEKYVGVKSEKIKLSFTDASIILTMQEYNIENLVSFDDEFKRSDYINLIKE